MIERIELAPGYSISRVIKGGWHLAGGHGQITEQDAIKDMLSFVEAGITTFDCADIYTGVEELIGRFLQEYRNVIAIGDLPGVQIHTKYVPDYNSLSQLTKKDTTRIIDRSLLRLGVERLDLVQFAWWDYQVPGYVETALHLQDLVREGKIRFLGATNFDGTHLLEMLDAGVDFLAHQVQYSVLDQRVEKDLQPTHSAQDIHTLCYGVIAGGFLSDRYLDRDDPIAPLENRSLTKYRLIIEEFGGWEAFQKALMIYKKLADKYEVGIAEVVARYILQKPGVAGIIVGARNTRHLHNLKKIFDISLTAADVRLIDDLKSRYPGPQGPFYALERIKDGPHGRIMKYNLNQ